MCDARDAGVDIFTLGQYLQPTPAHLPVAEFVTPDKFEHWRRFGMEEIGFRWARLGWLRGWMISGPAWHSTAALRGPARA